jgi:intein-encoded DNA endonuclease-like protein
MEELKKIKISKEEIVRLYTKEKKTLKEIAQIAGCHLSNIYGHLNRMGIKRRSFSEAGRIYSIDETFFEKIDTEEKAYILGFIYADGYNQTSRSQIRITINKKDIDILEKINKCLKNTKPILYLKSNTIVDISINSVKMSKDLEKLGCMQNKTFKLKFPYFIDKSLIRHFIRGYVDGDGCLSITNRKDRPSNTYQFHIVGRYEMLKNIQDVLVKELNISQNKIHPQVNIFMMIYSGKQNFKKITHYLYGNSKIYLERKFNLYHSTFTQ